MKQIAVLILLFSALASFSQEKNLPYREIEEQSSTKFTGGEVLARFIDGLGFRYYWATKGLREEDYNFRPNAEARSTGETIEHILGLVKVIHSAANLTSKKSAGETDMESIRSQTLKLLKEAADEFRQADDLSNYSIKSKGGATSLWYLMNGPINDATWHTGQIASYRRTSGNPINSNISHFTGKVKK